MKNKICFAIFFALAFSLNAMPQNTEQTNAKFSDVGSIDSIMSAVYDVISGDAGKPRDWNRFRSLFHKDARLIPTGKNPQTNLASARMLSPEDYIKRVEPVFAKEGFYEKEVARREEIFGNIAHVFSTYESRHQPDDKKPFARGINSFQLLNDGTRWWVINIFWQAETAENPLPKKYLKSKRS